VLHTYLIATTVALGVSTVVISPPASSMPVGDLGQTASTNVVQIGSTYTPQTNAYKPTYAPPPTNTYRPSANYSQPSYTSPRPLREEYNNRYNSNGRFQFDQRQVR
jgi:hypothetical protein